MENPVRQPAIAGEETIYETALSRAADLLQGATLPLISGMIGDLSDAQAALALAEHCGGVLDHGDGNSIATGMRVYQENGWLSTSFGEVRNRADLVVTIGDDIDTRYPRWREKVLDADERMHVEHPAQQIQVADNLLTILGEARALYSEKPVDRTDPASVSLVAAIKSATYPVFVIGELAGDDTDLILRAVVGLVRDINQKARAALLPLGGDNGRASAQLSAAWQTGFGIRTSFATGVPVQDWSRHATQAMLGGHEADVLVWISSLLAAPPPSADIPTIVIGHPATPFHADPEVFLPVCVPGVQRSGFMHRGDGLRLVPLRQLIPSDLPGTKALTDRLIQRLTRRHAAC